MTEAISADGVEVSDPMHGTLAAQALDANCAVVPRDRLEELAQALWAHPTMEGPR